MSHSDQNNMEERIRSIIEAGLSPQKLTIDNRSHLHQGHGGDNGTGQTHFQLIVEDKNLRQLSRIDRERKINSLLKPLFAEGLHALQIKVE